MTVVVIEKIVKHAYRYIYMFSLSSCLVIIIIEGIIADEIKEKKKKIISQEGLRRRYSVIYPVLLMIINQMY
jgi:hypothetical protein